MPPLPSAKRTVRLLAIGLCSVWCLLPVAVGTQPGDAAPQASTPTRKPASVAEQRVARHFDRIRRDPPALRSFLRAMPKGADLHTHLTGAVYAESYIQWATELPLCVDLSTFAFVEAAAGDAGQPGADVPIACKDPVAQRPASHVMQDPALYRSVIDALSTRHWSRDRGAGHYQFFDAFVKFGAVTREGRRGSAAIVGRSIAEVMQRAALQNVHHLELMMSFGAEAAVPAADVAWDNDEHFKVLHERILAGGVRGRVAERRQWLDGVVSGAREALRCDTAAALRGCDLSLRFMAYSLRGLAPAAVFAQATFAFELAAADPRIVGVNLVMPEDWYIPMRDYDLHMRMFRFLRRSYPAVNVALHAGELSFGLVPPEKLGLHVRQAIEVGGAQRIGHGTDIMHDSDPATLLATMARRRIAIEISLSSSDVILGIRGPEHPLRQFLRAGVPVVIATDDEGVSRSDLTNEYQRAAGEHGLGYSELKAISRNSAEYSFLPAGEKARLRRRLDAAFADFEARYR